MTFNQAATVVSLIAVFALAMVLLDRHLGDQPESTEDFRGKFERDVMDDAREYVLR